MLAPFKDFNQPNVKVRTLFAGLLATGLAIGLGPAAFAQRPEILQLEEFLAPPAPPPPSAPPAPPAAQPVRRSTPPSQDSPASPEPSDSRQVREPTERPSQVSNPRNPGDSRTTEQVESANVAVRTTSIPRLELGPEFGEGNYIVLMTYEGEDSLTQAREYSAGAFVKQIDGDRYIQLAVFDQLEYARHLADRLRRQGLSVLVAN